MSLPVLGLGGVDEDDTGFDTTDLTFWWRCQAANFSSTNGTIDYSAGDDTVSLEGSAAINTTAKYGDATNGLYVGGSDSRVVLTSSVSSIVTSEEGRVGFPVKIVTWDASAILFYLAVDINNSMLLKLGSSGELAINWINGGSAMTQRETTTSPVSTGTWYYIEYAWKTSSNMRKVYVDNTNVLSRTDTLTALAGTLAKMWLGDKKYVGPNAVFYIGNVRITKNSELSLYESRDQLNYDNS